MNFAEELHALTAERLALAERIGELKESQGTPPGVPIVATESDPAVAQLIRDWEDHSARDLDFWKRYKAARLGVIS